MTNTEPFDEKDRDIWEARLEAATTPEEKLAVLRACMPEEEAQASLSRILRTARGERGMELCTSIDINDLLDAAPTREEKLAILRKLFSEEEAQAELRIAMGEAQGEDGGGHVPGG